MMALAAAVALLLTGAFLFKSREARNTEKPASSPAAPQAAAVAVVYGMLVVSQNVFGLFLSLAIVCLVLA